METKDKRSSLFSLFVSDVEKSFTTPGANPIKLFTAVIYEFSWKASVFVPGETFQISLMYASKARVYSSGAPLKNSTLILFYYTYQQTL
jgi:hypothetical protein